MPIEFYCVGCNKKLRVGDDKAGKKVRCPQCQAISTALEIVEALAPKDEPARAKAPPSPLFGDESDEQPFAVQETETDRQPPKKRRLPRRVKPIIITAETKLRPVATALKAIAYVSIAVDVFLLITTIMMMFADLSDKATKPSRPAFPGSGSNGPLPMPMAGGSFAHTALAIYVCKTIISGAEAMSAKNDYRASVIACVLAMLPCTPCCILGFPVGLWGLIVLMQPMVRDSFR
jgi:hypothetical protein